MPFKKFVEIGRVAVMTSGPKSGSIATVVNVIDQNRVLIDGPGIERQAYRIKDLHLTYLRARFPFNARTKVVRKAWDGADISVKWKESAWAKRMEAKARRASLGDFDRFKLNKARSTRNRILAGAYNVALRKSKHARKVAKKTKSK